MKMTNGIKRGLLVGCGAGVLAFALAASPARADTPPPTQPGAMHTATQTTHASVTVTAVDKSARKLTIKTADGDKFDVNVPPEVTNFEKLKAGDKIDIDYSESVAIGMAPKGAKPAVSERAATMPGAAGREMTVMAEVTKVDTANNKVTFKGPKGKMKTVTVEDPELQARLPNLKPGQVMMFQYTEAVAAAIQPPAK
jgi:Cu/Ag efflux protein CusF